MRFFRESFHCISCKCHFLQSGRALRLVHPVPAAVHLCTVLLPASGAESDHRTIPRHPRTLCVQSWYPVVLAKNVPFRSILPLPNSSTLSGYRYLLPAEQRFRQHLPPKRKNPEKLLQTVYSSHGGYICGCLLR